MDGDIKKLIELAKSAGSLTQRQKEVILDKARVAGYDVDEVEMMIETIPIIEERPKIVSKVKKCPHCGATLSDFVLQCPECGYVFSDESQVSERNRNYLADLHSRLQKIENRAAKTKDEREYDYILKNNKLREKANLINSFSVPNTKEALMQALLGCYSAYEGSESINELQKKTGTVDIKQAWLGKAKEFYLLLQSQPKIDPQTLMVLNKYEGLFLSAEKKEKNNSIITYIIIISFVLFVLGIIIVSPMI